MYFLKLSLWFLNHIYRYYIVWGSLSFFSLGMHLYNVNNNKGKMEVTIKNISHWRNCTFTDFLKFVGPSDRAGRKSQGLAILPSMPVRVSDKFFCLCILFCTGNRKCNWYAGMIMVNSELISASNDIYLLNMQLFPW